MKIKLQHLRKWRLILGGHQQEGTRFDLDEADLKVDGMLGALYNSDKSGGLGASSPNVSR